MLAAPLSFGTKYAVLDDALWKWSEFYGKHDGCPYWPVEGRKIGGPAKALRHEHLIPRSVLIAELMAKPPEAAEALMVWLNRHCPGVVVTRADGFPPQGSWRTR